MIVADPVHDTQRGYRALLDALAMPGRIVTPGVAVQDTAGLPPSLALAALVLFDAETLVWLQPGIADEVRHALAFCTGCRFTAAPHDADFAVITDPAAMPTLAAFGWGTAEEPERSTTLLIAVAGLEGGRARRWRGPGIDGAIDVAPQSLPERFWVEWAESGAAYPRGVDCFLCDGIRIAGLPRTTRSEDAA